MRRELEPSPLTNTNRPPTPDDSQAAIRPLANEAGSTTEAQPAVLHYKRRLILLLTSLSISAAIF